MKKSAWVLLACAALSNSSLAAETTDKTPWSADASLTYVLNNGNTKSETFGSKAKWVHDRQKWRT